LHVKVDFTSATANRKLHAFRVTDRQGRTVSEIYGFYKDRNLLVFEGDWSSLQGLYLDGLGHREPLVPAAVVSVKPAEGWGGTPQHPPVAVEPSIPQDGESTTTPPVPLKFKPVEKEPVAGPVLLLQVELGQAGAAWPFATGLAVGKNLVLTSGAAGCYLEDFRQKQYRVWATHEAGPLKVEVGEIRVHAHYLQLLKAARDAKEPGDLKELRFFDLALLTIKGELPQTAPLAAPEDMANLADGYPVVFRGYTFHKGQKITEFFKPADQRRQIAGEVFAVLSPPDQRTPTGPRAVAFRASLPDSAFGAMGSPLFNAQGRVVAIYSEPAPKEEKIENLHYATAVNAAAVPGDANVWVSPLVDAPAEKPKEAGQ
jgi:hypothetical protein